MIIEALHLAIIDLSENAILLIFAILDFLKTHCLSGNLIIYHRKKGKNEQEYISTHRRILAILNTRRGCKEATPIIHLQYRLIYLSAVVENHLDSFFSFHHYALEHLTD